jgi:peptidyl-prolyl cis-trans isomerase SurA
MNWKHVSAAAALGGGAQRGPCPRRRKTPRASPPSSTTTSSRPLTCASARRCLMVRRLQQTPELPARPRPSVARSCRRAPPDRRSRALRDHASNASTIDRRLADIARQNETTVEAFCNALRARRFHRHAPQPDRSRHRLAASDRRHVRFARAHLRRRDQRNAAAHRRQRHAPAIPDLRDLPAGRFRAEFAEMEQGAMRLLEQMQRGAPFPLVARQFSQSPSAAAGGDIGWIAPRTLARNSNPSPSACNRPSLAAGAHETRRLHHRHARSSRGRSPLAQRPLVRCVRSLRRLARQSALERVQRRLEGCGDLDGAIAGIQGANVVDLGQSQEAELSPRSPSHQRRGHRPHPQS